jgi:hypothetical protein
MSMGLHIQKEAASGMAHEAWTYYTGPSPLELFELPSDSKSKLDVSIDELI